MSFRVVIRKIFSMKLNVKNTKYIKKLKKKCIMYNSQSNEPRFMKKKNIKKINDFIKKGYWGFA